MAVDLVRRAPHWSLVPRLQTANGTKRDCLQWAQVRTRTSLFLLDLAGHSAGTLAPRCSLLSRMFYNLLRAVRAPDAGQYMFPVLHLPKDHRRSNRQPRQISKEVTPKSITLLLMWRPNKVLRLRSIQK